MRETSDGSTASYYELPDGAKELQHLISHRNMNAQIGEIFRAAYRYGQASHSDMMRDAKKILFYAQAEVERLELEQMKNRPSGVPYTPDELNDLRKQEQDQRAEIVLNNIKRLRDRDDIPRSIFPEDDHHVVIKGEE